MGKGMGVRTVIVMTVSFLVLAILAPTALTNVSNANTANWNASVITIFQTLLPIIWVIGIALMYLRSR